MADSVPSTWTPQASVRSGSGSAAQDQSTALFRLPIKTGLLVTTGLTSIMLISLSALLWADIANHISKALQPGTNIVFILSSGVGGLFLLTSLIGSIGGVVCNVIPLLQVYSFFMYLHLALSLLILFFFTYLAAYYNCPISVSQRTGVDLVTAQDICKTFLGHKSAYAALSFVGFFLEIYFVVTLTRYSIKAKRWAQHTPRISIISFATTRRYTVNLSQVERGLRDSDSTTTGRATQGLDNEEYKTQLEMDEVSLRSAGEDKDGKRQFRGKGGEAETKKSGSQWRLTGGSTGTAPPSYEEEV